MVIDLRRYWRGLFKPELVLEQKPSGSNTTSLQLRKLSRLEPFLRLGSNKPVSVAMSLSVPL